ncbi:hypothetical protein TrRE_jg11171, partial [Triparma retinervis]
MSDSEEEGSPILKLSSMDISSEVLDEPPTPADSSSNSTPTPTPTPTPEATSTSSNPSPPPPPRLSPAHFLFGRTLGEGSYARVVHARYKGLDSTSAMTWGGGERDYAVKVMEKRHIKREDKVKYVMLEKSLLSAFTSTLILSLHVSFQDQDYLYLCMDMCPGGELLGVIRYYQERRVSPGSPCCPTPVTQYYLASIILALEYLHNLNVIHRDLKPENVLILADGRMKLGDFGTALDIDGFGTRGRRASPEDSTAFVGTAEYVSPEVLEGNDPANPAVDLWAVGVIAYHMENGRVMWKQGDTEFQVFQAINSKAKGEDVYDYPDFFNPDLKDLVEQLLKGPPMSRLGMSSFAPGTNFKYTSIRSHPYFVGFDWDLLSSGSLPSPHTPCAPKWLSVPDSSLTDGAMELESYFLDGEATPLTIAAPSRSPPQPPPAPRPSSAGDEHWMSYVRGREEGE